MQKTTITMTHLIWSVVVCVASGRQHGMATVLNSLDDALGFIREVLQKNNGRN